MTTITIKYSLEGNIAKYPNFNEILVLGNVYIERVFDYDSSHDDYGCIIINKKYIYNYFKSIFCFYSI